MGGASLTVAPYAHYQMVSMTTEELSLVHQYTHQHVSTIVYSGYSEGTEGGGVSWRGDTDIQTGILEGDRYPGGGTDILEGGGDRYPGGGTGILEGGQVSWRGGDRYPGGGTGISHHIVTERNLLLVFHCVCVCSQVRVVWGRRQR